MPNPATEADHAARQQPPSRTRKKLGLYSKSIRSPPPELFARQRTKLANSGANTAQPAVVAADSHPNSQNPAIHILHSQSADLSGYNSSSSPKGLTHAARWRWCRARSWGRRSNQHVQVTRDTRPCRPGVCRPIAGRVRSAFSRPHSWGRPELP